jgi:hypothetical protein
MAGIELAVDRKTKDPASAYTKQSINLSIGLVNIDSGSHCQADIGRPGEISVEKQKKS